MKFKHFIIFISLLIQNLSVYSNTLDNKNKINDFDNFVDSIYKNLDITGLAIVITKDGEIIYENYLGFKILPSNNREGEILNKNNLFRIASISKTFIATIIMRLKEDGLLNLEDDAQQYLSFPLRNPNYPEVPISIHHLLTHTSSINDSQGYKSLDFIIPEKNKDYKNSYSETPPGKAYKYCNFNYNILGAIIENITSKRIDKVVDKYILSPLSINASFDPNQLDDSKFVSLYIYNEEKERYIESTNAYKKNIEEIKKYKLGDSTAILSPCGGMKITARDLAKYMNMHLNNGSFELNRIITAESEALMRQNYVGKSNYGYSYRQYKDLCPFHTLSGQTGGSYGLKSAMIFDPEENIGFVIISSGSKSKYIDGSGDIHNPIIKKFYSLTEKDNNEFSNK